MTVDQVAREMVSSMTDVEKVKSLLAPGAEASGGVLPGSVPAAEAFNLIQGAIMTAFPDLKFDVQQVTTNGDQATVQALITGTHSGALSLPVGAMSVDLPATGKKVSVKDSFVVTVKDDKVTHFHVDSPAEGGIPGILGQLGISLPGMM